MWRFAPTLQMYLSVALTAGDKATATMADIKSETEMQCPEELPEYTSAAPTIRTNSVEAKSQNSEDTRLVREMEEGVIKAKMRACYNEHERVVLFVLGTLALFGVVGLLLLFTFVTLPRGSK